MMSQSKIRLFLSKQQQQQQQQQLVAWIRTRRRLHYHLTSVTSSSSSSSCFNNKNDENKNVGMKKESFPIMNVTFPSLLSSSFRCNRNKYITTRNHFFSTNSSSSSSSSSEEDSIPEYVLGRRTKVRNVAIVAHVDHGKTTLVDELIKISNTNTNTDTNTDTNNSWMDIGDLEQERGITITSKVTRLMTSSSTNEEEMIWNVVDTPGHADFAGEVDRILSLVDGVCLLVDAAEGPKSQTKYVLSRAISLQKKPIVLLNKCDRMEAIQKLESGQTETQILELFDTLHATDDQMDYTTLYASAKAGWCTNDLDRAIQLSTTTNNNIPPDCTMNVVLDTIQQDIPPPLIHLYHPPSNSKNDHDLLLLDPMEIRKDPIFSMTATNVGYDSYLGRMCTGRIYSGSIGLNDTVFSVNTTTTSTNHSTTVKGLFFNRGVLPTPFDPKERCVAGDIVTIAGVPDTIQVGDTLTSTTTSSSIKVQPIETPPLAPPTLSCIMSANHGPLMGKEGKFVTASLIRQRLIQETDNNVTLSIEPMGEDSTLIYGRGELQLGIMMEQMRREGFEFLLSTPTIVTSTCPITGQTLEPYEEVIVDVELDYVGPVMEFFTSPQRRGICMDRVDDDTTNNSSSSSGTNTKTCLTFHMPSRGLLGYSSDIATLTRGTAVVHHTYLEDRPLSSSHNNSGNKGKLVSSQAGKATLYALASIANRGTLTISPGDVVYPGMIIGEYNKGTNMDLEVNPVKSKGTSNVRSVNKDEKIYLAPPKQYTLEEYIGNMQPDELLEITPTSLRLRKVELDSNIRARQNKQKKKSIQQNNNTTKTNKK